MSKQTAKGTGSREANVIPFRDKIKLAKYVEENFKTMSLPDVEFAAKATEAMGFLVNANNILGLRRDLDIPSARSAMISAKDGSAIAKLEARIATLERRIDIYMGATK